jgi:hypothetical protein
MNIAELREMIKDCPDDMPVIIEFEMGFISACNAESQVVNMGDGEEKAFYIAPCTCHEDDMEFDFSADDLPISEN